MTGAATSVIGVSDFNDDGVYSDASKWTTDKLEGRVNEHAKFQAEKVCWNEIIGYKTDSVHEFEAKCIVYLCERAGL